MKTNRLLVTVIILQGLILIGQWTGAGYLTSAQAQVPDPANRQLQMVEALKSIDTKLDTIVGVLQGGDLQVKVANTEDKKGDSHGKK
jgi:hypothetical protein